MGEQKNHSDEKIKANRSVVNFFTYAIERPFGYWKKWQVIQDCLNVMKHKYFFCTSLSQCYET